MSANASQITEVSMVCSAVCSGADQRNHQSSASLAFVRGIHRWPVSFPHKGPVIWKMFPFDDVIMKQINKKMQWNPGEGELCVFVIFMANLPSLFSYCIKYVVYSTAFSQLWFRERNYFYVPIVPLLAKVLRADVLLVCDVNYPHNCPRILLSCSVNYQSDDATRQ